MLFGKKEVTADMVLGALKHVQEPELHKDLVTLNMVKDIQVQDGDVVFTVTLTTPACPLKSQIETAANIVKTNPSVFLDADIIAFNGDVQIVINTAKIGQISIPQDQLEENVDSINENLKEVLDSLEIQIESISTMNDIVDIQFCLNQTR